MQVFSTNGICSAAQDRAFGNGLGLAGRQIGEPKISDSHTDQAQRWMTNGRSHFADLPVFTLNQLERYPTIGNGFAETNGWVAGRDNRRAGRNIRTMINICRDGLRFDYPGPAWQSFTALDDYSALQVFQFFRGWNPFDLGPVFALMGLAGMQEFLVQAGIIAQQEKTFGIGIKPANGPKIFREIELGEGAVFGAVAGELRQHAKRLVKCENQGPVRALWFPRNYTVRF
jgi:hypothetical protein